MATRFVRQARQQLAPAFQQQQAALRSQIPAIQQLYQTLIGGLQGERQTGTQNILEGQSGRGLLRSTITGDQQAGLEAGLLQKQGQLQAQQLGEIGQVRQGIADVGVQRAQGIADLAGTLQQRQLAQQQFNYQKQLSERRYQLDQRRVQGGF